MSDEPEIRLNDDGSLDEVVGNGVTVHLEQMDDGLWFLGVYGGKKVVQVWLRSKRPIKANYEESRR